MLTPCEHLQPKPRAQLEPMSCQSEPCRPSFDLVSGQSKSVCRPVRFHVGPHRTIAVVARTHVEPTQCVSDLHRSHTRATRTISVFSRFHIGPVKPAHAHVEPMPSGAPVPYVPIMPAVPSVPAEPVAPAASPSPTRHDMESSWARSVLYWHGMESIECRNTTGRSDMDSKRVRSGSGWPDADLDWVRNGPIRVGMTRRMFNCGAVWVGLPRR